MYRIGRLISYLGFAGTGDLVESLIRPKIALLWGSISVFGTVTLITNYIQLLSGLKPLLWFGLHILLIVELISGLLASKLRGRKLTSRRLQRFGVMVLIWFTLLFVMNGMIDQYEGRPEEHVAYYMHTTMVFYIIGVYTKSVLENAETIWKKRMNIKLLLKNLFNINEDDSTRETL